jgi:5-methylcytosine-specific restriction endonuclease McrA
MFVRTVWPRSVLTIFRIRSIQRIGRTSSSFIIQRFFEKFPKSLHLRKPQNDYISAPINDYTEDFEQISMNVKAARGYKCEKCNLAPEIRYLHVHHINGQKHDNIATNLRVLCYGCHAAMPLHAHMKRTKGFDEFQRKYDPTA